MCDRNAMLSFSCYFLSCLRLFLTGAECAKDADTGVLIVGLLVSEVHMSGAFISDNL